MPEGVDLTRLHPDDLKIVAEKAAAALAAQLALPPPAMPPGVMNGQDLSSLRAISPDMSALERLVKMLCQQMISGFKTEDQINAMIDTRVKTDDGKLVVAIVDSRLKAIGLRMDEDHIEETGDAVKWWIKWHRLGSKIWMAATISVGAGVAAWAAKKLGVPFQIGSG